MNNRDCCNVYRFSCFCFFFSNSDFPSRMCCDFFRKLYFWRSYFSKNLFITFPYSGVRHYFTTSTQQLHFRSNYFFRAAVFFLLFQNSHFFRAVIFLEQLLFQSENSTEQPLLENKKFFKAVTSRNSYFSLFRLKISKKSYFFKAGTHAQYQLFQKSYILEKPNFSEKQYSLLPTFSGELPFQSGYFFKSRYLLQQLLFQKSYIFITYFFRRVTISQLRFFSTAALLIYLFVIK